MLMWAVCRRPFQKAVQSCVCFHQQNTEKAVCQINSPGLLSRGLCVDRFVNSRTTSIRDLHHHYSCIRPSVLMVRNNSSSSSNGQQSMTEEPKLSNKDKLKRAVKDYGSTVFVFHIALSLTSLGISYLVISSGLDVNSLLDKVGVSSSSELVAGAGTFAVAYAVHKVFAPVRISITLGAAPFIVRYLRRIGVLKPPAGK